MSRKSRSRDPKPIINSEEEPLTFSPRVTSPSASIRRISNQRVNNERTHLLPRGIEYRSVYEGPDQPLYVGVSSPMIQEDSLNFSSVEEGFEGEPFDGTAVGTATSEYRPFSSPSDLVEWKELLPYYLPILSWAPNYSWNFFIGDFIGGLSLVFFQLPLSISYATSLAHVPVLCGLLSLGVSPFVYLIFGSVPQMIVGPESAISLIVGQAVEPILHHNKHHPISPIDLVVSITFISGATLLGFGLGRFGFLDNVLSGSLLKGFISGVGIVMIINSLILALGLTALMKEISDDPSEMDIHSPFDKVWFLLKHGEKYDSLTLKISFVAFAFLLGTRVFKKYLSKSSLRHLEKLVYIPEILITVIIASVLCCKFSWCDRGIAIVGSVKEESGNMQLHNPLTLHQFKLWKKVGTSGFLCAMLGFFESTTALKSLGSSFNLPISSNRELVALGFINIIGSIFGALPAFGGYGRSKINAISAKTTTSGALMGVCTILIVTFLLDALYYIPKCILSVITAVIGLSLIEEAPYDLLFHWRSRGYNEIITFFVTVLTTLFFSMEAGIGVGLVYSLIRVIKHSTLSRIEILGRIPGTNTFVDADINVKLLTHSRQGNTELSRAKSIGKLQLNLFTDDYFTSVNMNVLEEIEGCLIVKIPEPLTFTNTNDLRARLKRVEMYGSTKAHPGMKRSRDESMTHYVIFDMRGMTEVDSSAAQILRELLIAYQERNIKSFFVRVSKHEQVRNRLHRTGVTGLLQKDLESVKYYEVQDCVRDSETFASSEANSIYKLTEATGEPYFEHISDALKVVDYYELFKDKLEQV